jgi:S-adenosylmethionine hydrolase
VVALSLLSAGAFAYWSNAGEASASASLATLTAPTISSATAGAGTVALTWSAVTAPSSGTVDYYVTRDGGAPSSGCPSSSTPSTATSCTDTGVSIGAHEYTVTAVWRSWTATSTAKSVSVAFGPATHFQIQAASTTPTANETDNLTITAKDASNNTVSSYSGSKTLTFSEPASSPSGKAPSYPATVTFTAGVGTAAVKLYDAQTTTVKAKEGTLEGTSPSLTVKAAATKKLSVPTPGEQEAGVAFNVTLTATDEYGNLTTSYTGEKTLTWSGPANSPSGQAPEYPVSATTVTFANGVGTAGEIELYDAVAATVTLTVKEGSTVKGTSGPFTVKAASANSFSVPTPSEQTAGAVSVKVTAIDEWGNTAKGYVGAKTLIWSGPSNSPSGQAPSYPATVTFAAGAGTASIKLYDAQSTTLKATEGSIECTTGSFAVKAAATKKFSVPAPGELEAGVAFNVTLTATDEWGNLTAGYAGSKTLTFSEPANSPSGKAPEYPTSATTVTFTAGVGTASQVKLYDAQSTTLKVKEGATVVGTSGSFTVKATTPERFAWAHAEAGASKLEGAACLFACTTPSIGNSKKFKAHASITDAYGNIVSNIGATTKAKVEKTSGEGTLTNATGLTIPTSGLAESSTIFEYTSPASGTSEAILKLKSEEGAAYTEAEAHVKY